MKKTSRKQNSVHRLLGLLMALLLGLLTVSCAAGNKQDTSETSDLSSSTVDLEDSEQSNASNSETDTEEPNSTDSGGATTAKNQQTPTSTTTKLDSNKTKSGSGGSLSQMMASMPKELRGTQLELFHWNPVSELPGGSQLLKNFEKQAGIKVKWTVASYDNYDVELQARVASSNSPDIVLFQWMNANRMTLCQPVSNSGYSFEGEEWDSAVKQYYSSPKGTVYAVNLKDTLLQRPAVILYNRPLIEIMDFEDPYTLWKQGKWTEKKFMEMCKEYKKATGKKPWVISKFDLWPLLVGLQGEMSYSNGKYSSNLNNPKLLTAWQKCADLHWSEELTDRTWNRRGFDNGEYLFMDTSLLFTRTTQPYFTKMKSDGTLGVVPYFTIEGQSTYYQPMDEYEAYGIAKGAKNIKAVPYFLRYYLAPENYDEKTFFCSLEALDVYKYCLKQQNRVMHNRYPLGSGNSKSPAFDLRLAVERATSAQIPTIINTYKSLVDTCVSDLNSKLKTLS